MGWIEGIGGVLLDVDGTLLTGDEAIPGAAAALERLRKHGMRIRLTTNTTRRPRSAVAAALTTAGLEVVSEEVLAPCVLARKRILESGCSRAALLVPPASREDFAGIEEDETHPAWVVVGDLGRGFTWERLNQAFHWVRDGARLLALHKNRYWHAGKEGVVIDAGAFVAALEYAAGVEAETVGKPARGFFELCLADIGLAPPQVLVVGDDLENDCGGGAAVGCLTALVRTGTGGSEPVSRKGTRPDLVLGSVAELLAES